MMDMSRFTRGQNQFPEIVMLFMLEMRSRSGTACRLLAGTLPVPARRTVDMYSNSGAGVAGHCVMFGVQTYLAREVSALVQHSLLGPPPSIHLSACAPTLLPRCVQAIIQAAINDGLTGDALLDVRARIENVHVSFDGCKIPAVRRKLASPIGSAWCMHESQGSLMHFFLLQGKTKSNPGGYSQGYSESMFSRHNAAHEGAKQREQDPTAADCDGITKQELLEFAVNQGLAGNDLMIWCASSVGKYKNRGVEAIIRVENKW